MIRRPQAAEIAAALGDIRSALARKGLWMALAVEDVGDAHRRTLLGPLWLLANFLIFVGVIVFIIRSAGGVAHFPAYVSCGLLVWLFMAETINESVTLFHKEESFIKGTVLPLFLYVLRQVTRTAIRSSFALAGTLGILVLSGVPVVPAWPAAVPGLALVLCTAPAVTLVLAICGAFFRDIQFFVTNIMRLGMFLTPIFWSHENVLGVRSALYYWNPFTHYIDIVRMPLVTGEVPVVSWAVAIGLSSALWLAAISLLGRFRRRIVFLV